MTFGFQILQCGEARPFQPAGTGIFQRAVGNAVGCRHLAGLRFQPVPDKAHVFAVKIGSVSRAQHRLGQIIGNI